MRRIGDGPPEQEAALLALRVYDGDDDEPSRIAAAAAGDAASRAWLVERWTPPVWRFCRRMLANDEDAHDAAQETLVKVLRHLTAYDPNRSFTTWLFGIARNTCIDEHRRRARRSWEEPGEIHDPAPSPVQRVVDGEQARILTASLAELPEMYREILVLYHFEHLKYHEIAEALSLPIGTVMNRIFRARQKLRAGYEERGGEP
jgi:RNA polymerase sigma-70 factor (ECF subfamily)